MNNPIEPQQGERVQILDGKPVAIRSNRAWRELAEQMHADSDALKAALADVVSAVSRGAARGNPWRCDALKRAAAILNPDGAWAGDGYRALCTPAERAARAAQYEHEHPAYLRPGLYAGGQGERTLEQWRADAMLAYGSPDRSS